MFSNDISNKKENLIFDYFLGVEYSDLCEVSDDLGDTPHV